MKFRLTLVVLVYKNLKLTKSIYLAIYLPKPIYEYNCNSSITIIIITFILKLFFSKRKDCCNLIFCIIRSSAQITTIVISSVVGGILIILALIFACCCVYRCRRKYNGPYSDFNLKASIMNDIKYVYVTG